MGNIFEDIGVLDSETQSELESLDSEYQSNDYEIDKTIDRAIEEFIKILEKHCGKPQSSD